MILTIIGLLVLSACGIYLILASVGMLFIRSCFSQGDATSTILALIPAGIGVLFLWIACHFSPFTITIQGF